MITSSRRASLSMLAHRTRILSSLHAHQLASPSAPDGPPSLHVQRAEDDVTSGRAARCSASACEAATWTCSSTTARELPVLSGFCILLLNVRRRPTVQRPPAPHARASGAVAQHLSLQLPACMHSPAHQQRTRRAATQRSQFIVAALCRSQVPCRLDGARALQAHAAYTTGVLCSSAAHVARTRASRAPRALRSAPRAARIVLDML